MSLIGIVHSGQVIRVPSNVISYFFHCPVSVRNCSLPRNCSHSSNDSFDLRAIVSLLLFEIAEPMTDTK